MNPCATGEKGRDLERGKAVVYVLVMTGNTQRVVSVLTLVLLTLLRSFIS